MIITTHDNTNDNYDILTENKNNPSLVAGNVTKSNSQISGINFFQNIYEHFNHKIMLKFFSCYMV